MIHRAMCVLSVRKENTGILDQIISKGMYTYIFTIEGHYFNGIALPLLILLSDFSNFLNRHVRVHHQDKDKDDAQLREVLAQRPEGPSRGRRRRGGS